MWALKTLANIRVLAIILTVVSAVGGIAWIKHRWDRAERAEAQAELARVQTDFDAGVREAADTYDAKLPTIRQHAQQGTTHVQRSPGAEAPLPAGLRAELCNALERLRDAPACAADQPAADAAH